MSSTLASMAATAASSASTSAVTQDSSQSINNTKPSQLYVYPSVAVIIFLLAGIHICRFFDSQRMVRQRRAQRQAYENAALDRWRSAAGLGKEVRAPTIFDAVLGAARPSEIGGSGDLDGTSNGWKYLLPISTNIQKLPRPPPPKPAPPTQPLPQSPFQMLASGTKRIFRRRLPQPQAPPHSLQPPAPSVSPNAKPPTQATKMHPEYVHRPQTLISGILISLPDSRRPIYQDPNTPISPTHQPIPSEDLPPLCLGYTEVDWSQYGEPNEPESEDEHEPRGRKSSIISPSMEGVLFDRPW